jgi:hypothetical protein
MKYLRIVVLFLFVMMMSPTPAPAGQSHSHYWQCMQTAIVKGQAVMYISDIQKNHWEDYKHRELKFQERIAQITKGQSDGYEPMCVDFRTKKEAEQLRAKLLKSAKAHKMKPIKIKFKYEGLQHVQQKKNDSSTQD